MQVRFFGKTQVDLKSFLAVVKHKLGRALKVDDQRYPLDHPLCYLLTLTDFKDVPSDIGNLGALLKHEHHTFIMTCTEREMTEVVLEAALAITITPDKELAILSGTLEQWRTTIINGSSESALDSVRIFANSVLLEFERMGLKSLWTNYTKGYLKDGTFKLIEKK